ncbi:MAG: hypothetical protein EOP37_03405 [Rubrivivax sp.]|nr:MAG: hypothetical protein EOP37_03405 [Rubrivivax sp.]
MARPQKATIQNELGGTIGALILGGSRYLEKTDFVVRSIDAQIDKLQKVDALAASIHRGMLYHITGELDESLYWLDNARRLKADPHNEFDLMAAIVLSNLGYFSRAAQLLSKVADFFKLSNANLLLLTGSWSELSQLNERLDSSKDEEGVAAIAKAQRCCMTLKQIGVSEDQVKAMLDVAGEVMRSHRMLFLEDAPIVRETGDVVLYQLLVKADRREAIKMTDEVLMKMIQRDLDVPGLAFSFIAG